jgi:SAM-dependent methyltransferase
MTGTIPSRAEGTENLEIMTEAVNYNSWLLALTRKNLTDARRVVDFGAGRGQFAIPLQAEGRSIVAIEPEPNARAVLRAACVETHRDLAAVERDSIDAAYTLNVLEHIADDGAALRDLRRCLRPGGTLFIYVPAFMCLFTAMDRRVGHIRRYRKRELARRVRDAGFVVDRSRYADALGFFATLAYRWLGSPHGDIDRNMLRAYDRFVFPVSRALDALVGRFFGKNVWLAARRPH